MGAPEERGGRLIGLVAAVSHLWYGMEVKPSLSLFIEYKLTGTSD